jgi:hypothetical protein
MRWNKQLKQQNTETPKHRNTETPKLKIQETTLIALLSAAVTCEVLWLWRMASAVESKHSSSFIDTTISTLGMAGFKEQLCGYCNSGLSEP